jgi:error-prone DNA polymerase
MRHGRDDQAKIGTRDRVRDGPREIVDAPPIGIPEQRAEVPAIPVATFDFR